MAWQAEHLTPADYKEMPWKNGLGLTTELLIHPPGATVAESNFLWRISCAKVPLGYSRIIVVSDSNAEVLLDHPGTDLPRVSIFLLQPYRFSGSIATECTLVGGNTPHVEDFNVIFKEQQVAASLSVLHLQPSGGPSSLSCTGDAVLVYCIRGSATVETASKDSAALSIGARETLLFASSSASQSLPLVARPSTPAAEATLFVVELRILR